MYLGVRTGAPLSDDANQYAHTHEEYYDDRHEHPPLRPAFHRIFALIHTVKTALCIARFARHLRYNANPPLTLESKKFLDIVPGQNIGNPLAGMAIPEWRHRALFCLARWDVGQLESKFLRILTYRTLVPTDVASGLSALFLRVRHGTPR